MHMNYLIKAQWGYQTICPDEQEITGYYKIDTKYSCPIYGWTKPSITSPQKEISDIVCYYSIWGWEEKYDKEAHLTWVKVSNDPVFWIPKKYTDIYEDN